MMINWEEVKKAYEQVKEAKKAGLTTTERIAELKMYFTRCVQSRSLSTVVHLAECGLELIEMVEALQQENEQLKADLRGKDNEINDLKALIEYLRKFKLKKNEAVREGSV